MVRGAPLSLSETAPSNPVASITESGFYFLRVPWVPFEPSISAYVSSFFIVEFRVTAPYEHSLDIQTTSVKKTDERTQQSFSHQHT